MTAHGVPTAPEKRERPIPVHVNLIPRAIPAISYSWRISIDAPLVLAFGRKRVFAVTVPLPNLAISAMNKEFGALVLRNFPCA